MMQFVMISEERLLAIEKSLLLITERLEAKKPEKSLHEWLTKRDACVRLKVCNKTLDTYLKKGIIPFTKFKAKIYIKLADIEGHLQKYYVVKSHTLD